LAPTNVLVRIRPDPAAAPATDATFHASANGSTPVRYQWRFAGANLPHATNTTLTITNVQLADGGEYQCAITDDVGTIFTSPAKLIPLITPVIAQAPLSQTVPQGGPVSVSVTLGHGSPPPFYYEWRRVSNPIGRFTNDFKTNAFTFLAGNNVGSLACLVVITNLATLSPQAPTFVAFTITTRADHDRDGLPDDYEVTLGLNTNNVADAALDLDGDTMSNLAEYLAGTDPADPNSYLRVDHTSQPGVTLLTIAAVSNRTYSIQFKGDLNAAAWSKHADVPAQAVNHVATLAVPNAPTNRFRRVSVPASP
ncbi:MAG: immunoglobulin domain-containing protein, partial [Gammaproteobacteria bacterium]